MRRETTKGDNVALKMRKRARSGEVEDNSDDDYDDDVVDYD
jgi:hypothetical protein